MISSLHTRLLLSWLLIFGLIAVFYQKAVYAESSAAADVVVIVDTSTSMQQAGMDRERASLLFTKLLADISPGNLAVIRLLDIGADSQLLPHTDTGESLPCSEDPKQTCHRVKPTSDWNHDARQGRFGALIRPDRADAGFKQALEQHLIQDKNNSMFNLALQSALGVFDQHVQQGLPSNVIWLSDGHTDNEELVSNAIAELKAQNVFIDAIVFGQGDVKLAQQLKIDVQKVRNPAEMMTAFANAFRRIVQAPYRVDNQLAVQAQFQMKPGIQEAWVVVYGNKDLNGVSLSGPNQSVNADYASDVWPDAGAYQVAYLRQPTPGQWTVNVKNGQNVAYAVIQRSDLIPVLISPTQTNADAATPLIADIQDGNGNLVNDPELLSDAVITAKIGNQNLVFSSNAQDGHFYAEHTFKQSGEQTLQLHLKSSIADRLNTAKILVNGRFAYSGPAIELNLGGLGTNAQACQPLRFQADQIGDVLFELSSLKSLPKDHSLEIQTSNDHLYADSGSTRIKPGDALSVCLATGANAPSSKADGEAYLALHVANSQQAEQQIIIKLHWQVQGLTFWEIWRELIYIALAIISLLFVLLGYLTPYRFRATLAVAFTPERDEVIEQTAIPLNQWSGVGIGFYRHARAYLHPNYRLSGKRQGALAVLHAERNSSRVQAVNAYPLFRETLDGDWEQIPEVGYRCHSGDIFRIGSHGPYFRISTRG